jgi:RNA polymerase sigma factor (sigma-70 family)
MEAATAAQSVRRKNLSLRPAPGSRRQKKSFDAAFESFYREHVGEVYQYALAVLGNSADAEDVTQQTFLNAYRAFQRGERPRKPHNWLIKIAHNVCRMRWRRSGRRPQEVPLDRAAEPVAPDNESESLEEVLTALARLPFNQRAAIVMREVEGRSYAEIAEVLDTTVPAVEALLFRARGNLRARRKALAAALGVAPVPTSLGSFLGAGSGGAVAAGGALLGSELALKAAAVVATGVVAGSLGFKAVSAVATREPSATRLRQPSERARALAPTTLRRPAAARQRAVQRATFAHSRPAGSKQGGLRGAPTGDRPSESAPSGSAQETPAPSAAPSSTTASSSPAEGVDGVAASVPEPPATPEPPPTPTPTTPVAVTTPVASVTVTVPPVSLPPPPPLP